MPASHLKCHSHIKSVSLSCCGNLSRTLCPGWQRGPLLARRPGLGAGTSYSAHSNKGAHVPCLNRPATGPVVPQLLTAFRGETFPYDWPLGTKVGFLFLSPPTPFSLCYLPYNSPPPQRDHSCFCKEKHPLWGLPVRGMRIPILIKSPKGSY